MPGPGSKRMNPNGLVAGGVDDLPDVDLHPVAEQRELVDERDVDRAEDVLEQLRELRRLRAWRPRRPRRRSARRARRRGSRQSSVRPPTTFGVVRIVWSVRPGSMRSGEKARLKSRPAARPDSSRIGQQALAGGARVGGRLEHHQLALVQDPRERGRGVDDVAEVRLALVGERGRDADQDRVAGGSGSGGRPWR